MSKLDAHEVAALLAEYGRRSALRGGNPYRSKAYVRAAENLSAVAEPLERMVAEGRLQDIPGVGASIADVITKLHRAGTHPSLEKLRNEIPDSLVEMASIPGLRADQVVKLHRVLGIETLKDLEEAARADRIRTTKGLGFALQRKIVQGLEMRRTSHGARHIHRAAELLDNATRNLKRAHPEIVRVVPAGDFRRGMELVKDLALVVEAKSNDKPSTVRRGEISVHFSGSPWFGAALLHATGSPDHLRALEELAAAKGMRLTSKGLVRNGKLVASKTETDIYGALGLPVIEPELREGRGEVEQAKAGGLPEIVSASDIRGILHAHTDQSDGVHSLAEMAAATRERGYEYFGVADHSKSAHYAGGLSIEQIAAQLEAIDCLNRSYEGRFRIFKGIESDILPDGSLDYPDAVLRKFDFIVASVHGQFRMDEKAQTERILRALRNPFVTILGHMTGRQLLRRPGYTIDIERVLAACAENDVASRSTPTPGGSIWIGAGTSMVSKSAVSSASIRMRIPRENWI